MRRPIAPVPMVAMALAFVAMAGSAVEAQKEIVIWHGVLSAANEVAPVVVHPTEAGVSGSALINPGGFYFNVHTTLNPGGVARGQLALASGTAVPTLSQWGAIVMALLLITTATFFLRRRAA